MYGNEFEWLKGSLEKCHEPIQFLWPSKFLCSGIDSGINALKIIF